MFHSPLGMHKHVFILPSYVVFVLVSIFAEEAYTWAIGSLIFANWFLKEIIVRACPNYRWEKHLDFCLSLSKRTRGQCLNCCCLVLLLHILDNRLTKNRLIFKLMLDPIASLLETLASFSKDFGIWMEWEKSDCASILTGTTVQYKEVSSVQILGWFSPEEVLTPECPFLHMCKRCCCTGQCEILCLGYDPKCYFSLFFFPRIFYSKPP